MDPYRVLLVDDEEDIRVGISRKMDWAGPVSYTHLTLPTN